MIEHHVRSARRRPENNLGRLRHQLVTPKPRTARPPSLQETSNPRSHTATSRPIHTPGIRRRSSRTIRPPSACRNRCSGRSSDTRPFPPPRTLASVPIILSLPKDEGEGQGAPDLAARQAHHEVSRDSRQSVVSASGKLQIAVVAQHLQLLPDLWLDVVVAGINRA